MSYRTCNTCIHRDASAKTGPYASCPPNFLNWKSMAGSEYSLPVQHALLVSRVELLCDLVMQLAEANTRFAKALEDVLSELPGRDGKGKKS